MSDNIQTNTTGRLTPCLQQKIDKTRYLVEVHLNMISWDRLRCCRLWSAAIVCGACVIRLKGMCVSMGKNIYFVMPWDIGKGTFIPCLPLKQTRLLLNLNIFLTALYSMYVLWYFLHHISFYYFSGRNEHCGEDCIFFGLKYWLRSKVDIKISQVIFHLSIMTERGII